MVYQQKVRIGEVGKVSGLSNGDIVNAARLVTKGVIYPLGTERFTGMPNHPGTLPFIITNYVSPDGLRNEGGKGTEWILDPNQNKVQLGFNSEVMTCGMHSGTHIDALSHATMGDDDHWFGGFNAKNDIGFNGVLKCDASSMLPVFSRGVLLDVAGFKGVDMLPMHDAITEKDIENTLEWEKVKIRKGDVVLIRTGFADNYPDVVQDPGGYIRPGINKGAALWLAGKEVVAVGSDTESLEQCPCTDENNPHVVHTTLMIENGIHIMESVLTKRLADDKVYEFLFVALPLTVRGATGSMINPVAVI
jgi:kynurenine formamidase